MGRLQILKLYDPACLCVVLQVNPVRVKLIGGVHDKVETCARDGGSGGQLICPSRRARIGITGESRIK